VAKAAGTAKHPYVVSRKDYCGGSAVIKGTKFPVRAVVNYILRQGLTPEELVREFPHLTLAQVYDALSYYYDYKQDVERELQDSTEEQLRPESAT
jgi:uncharacterized protein (DUF433 family)